jgi:hypothetical protein
LPGHRDGRLPGGARRDGSAVCFLPTPVAAGRQLGC